MTAPASGRTADENEMREQIAKTIYEAFPIYCDNPRPKCAVWPWHVPPSATSHDRYYALADRLLSGPLAPILQEAATLRARLQEAERALKPFAALSFSFDGFGCDPATLVFQHREYGQWRSDHHCAFDAMIKAARAALAAKAAPLPDSDTGGKGA